MSAPDALAPGGSTPRATPVSPKKRRRWPVVLVIVIVLVAILLVVAELVTRQIADSTAEKQIESSLPKGTTGTVGVSIHGFSVLYQVLTGTLDDVSLTSHDLVVQKVPLSFTAEATDVPLAEGEKTGPVDADLTIDQAALNKTSVLKDAGGTVALGRGTFTYDSSISILSLSLKYKLTAKPTISSDGKSLILTPTTAAISSSNSSINVSSLLAYLKTQPPTICVAKSLPSSATLTKITVTPGVARVELHSTGLPLSDQALATTGKC